MAQTAIHTRTISIGTSYEVLDANSKNVLTIYAVSQDVHVVCGTQGLETATADVSFMLPAGAALEMNPAPKGEVYVRASVAGQISYWYS